MLNSPHLYASSAPASLPKQVIDHAIRQYEAPILPGLAPVLSLKHLSVSSAVPYDYLRKVVSREIDPYTPYSIRKNRDPSKVRYIAAPDENLQKVQQWILHRILDYVPMHRSSFAYEKNKSTIQAATRHLGSKWILKIDIKDYFHQFDEVQVFKAFSSLGYSRLVAFEMARLCTRLPHQSMLRWLPKKFTLAPQRDLDSFVGMKYSPGGLGYLPQGAPSSGALANLMTRKLDTKLSNFASENSYAYTRYADDLIFSSGSDFDDGKSRSDLAAAVAIVRKTGFPVNIEKTRLLTPGNRLIVLGLLVDGEILRLPRQLRREIELHIWGVEKFGLQIHSDRRDFVDSNHFLNYFGGLLDYANAVQPEFSRAARSKLTKAIGP